MKIAVIGGGPAGLYFALLIKKARPDVDITVLERNRRDDTFGWGVVFSDQTLENFRAADAVTCDHISTSLAHWDDIDVHVRDRVITSSGHGFSGIARKKLLNILQARCEELGVVLKFQADLRDDALGTEARSAKVAGLAHYGLADADLIVAADGVNSAMRGRHAAEFGPDLDVRTARYIWLGTTLPFEAFTFYFVENPHGVFQAHCYRFDNETSTFIVECDEASWRSAGFDRLDLPGTVAACETLFSQWLNGHRLRSNALPTAAPWTSFVRVRNRSWFHDRIVLIGDAAHTAHFSIGSGTKLAMEDAITLARVLADSPPTTQALSAYQDERMTEAVRLQNAARNSMEWFENVKRYIRLEPEQFTYSLLTRSQRVSHENLRLRDPAYLEGVERWFAAKAAPQDATPLPMFTPYSLRGLTLVNRVVVAPMDMYSAEDGTPGDFHLVHLGARALGGAGLVFTEMACVSPEARITRGCAGMYRAEHVAAWRRVVEFVHRNSDAKICLQLGHAGPKGSTRLPWAGGELELDEDPWAVIAPSAVRYAPTLQLPRAMTRAAMDLVRDDFVNATRKAIDAGFDMIELHCAHGYLLSSFITPLANHRADEYGGSIENRLRYPLEVFGAMRAVWPADRPMSVRISATDWVEDGVTGEDAVIAARAFAGAGVDIVHVSTGQTSIDARPVYGRMYQTPFSDQVRNELGIPTIAVGNITQPDQVNSIIAAGRADLCALARPHLGDPCWTLHAAAELGYTGQSWPLQYLTGKKQLERERSRKVATR